MMSWDDLQLNWPYLRRFARQNWTELSDDELCRIAGDPLELIDRIHQRYAIARAEAERQVTEWVSQLPATLPPAPQPGPPFGQPLPTVLPAEEH